MRKRRVYTAVGRGRRIRWDLEADPRGLVAAARSVLAHAPADSPQARDAAQALALLASQWHRRRESRQLGVPYGTCGSRRYDGNRRQDGI